MAAPNLHVSAKKEIYLDCSIKNADFIFAVEICNFSVFYSFNYYIIVELSSVQRDWKKLAQNC